MGAFRVNHEHAPRRARILPLQIRAIRVAWGRVLGEVLRVVDDAPDDLPAAQVRVAVRADLHLEVVEPLSDSFLRETCNFLIAVAYWYA